MFTLTFNQIAFTATLTIPELGEDDAYVIGDQLRAKLTIAVRRNLNVLNMNCQLAYVMQGRDKTSSVTTHNEKLLPYTAWRKGEVHNFDVNIPFHFGRTNFFGKTLKSFWQFKIKVVHEVPRKDQPLITLLAGKDKATFDTPFLIPVRAGKGSYRASAAPLPIPLISWKAIGVGTLVTFGLMTALVLLQKNDPFSQGLYLAIFLIGLLGLIAYHFLRLSSFKMTPMEIQPLRDGKLRVRYLNRGADHLKGAFIGLRLKERCVRDNDKNSSTNLFTVTHENRYRLSDVSRPLDHLNEATLPWPDGDYPTTYESNGQGYQWELFLASPGKIVGGYNEIRWPVRVDWEQMRIKLPTASELEEEKLELRELADNRVPS